MPLLAPASALVAPQDPCLRRCGGAQPASGSNTGCPSGSQVLQRLQRKRAAVEKEVSRVPGAPKTSKDVFQLCRGFERAFSYTVDVSCLPPTSRWPNGCPCFGTAARPAVRPGPALRRALLVAYDAGDRTRLRCAPPVMREPGVTAGVPPRPVHGLRGVHPARICVGGPAGRRAAAAAGAQLQAGPRQGGARPLTGPSRPGAGAPCLGSARSGHAGKCLTRAGAAAAPARVHRPARPGLQGASGVLQRAAPGRGAW